MTTIYLPYHFAVSPYFKAKLQGLYTTALQEAKSEAKLVYNYMIPAAIHTLVLIAWITETARACNLVVQ